MGKYQLIASIYEGSDRVSNEKAISVKGIDLTNLVEIDKFTASKSELDIWNIINDENDLDDRFNLLSIRHYGVNGTISGYLRIIANNKELLEVANNTKNGMKSQLKNKYVVGIVNTPDSFLKLRNELIKFLEIDKKRGLEVVDMMYSNKNNFANLLRKYFNTDINDGNERDELRREILDEFKGYKVFRGWIAGKERARKNIPVRHVQKRNEVGKTINKINHINSIEENEKDFENEYQKKYGSNYLDDKLTNYNIEYDEFIEPDEMEQMDGGKHI